MESIRESGNQQSQLKVSSDHPTAIEEKPDGHARALIGLNSRGKNCRDVSIGITWGKPVQLTLKRRELEQNRPSKP